jgi:prophage regulatory protein
MQSFLRISEVAGVTSMSRSAIYEMIKGNNFPRPRRLGKRAVGWLSKDIQNWIESRPQGGCWEDQS